jgi:uncharacterized membrane-anchored protein YitT (DUF2179 family)
MDILGVYLSKVRRNFSVGKLSYALNAVILTWNGILFGMQSALYSLLFVMVCYFVSDRVHIQNIDVWALIITVNPNIKHEINEQMGRGVTWWNGNGAYTGRQQEILVTCINKYEVRQLSKLDTGSGCLRDPQRRVADPRQLRKAPGVTAAGAFKAGFRMEPVFMLCR